MSFFKQTTGQAREAFTAMPMQSRVISVMLVAVIAIGLAFLVRDGRALGNVHLFGGRSFSEQELDAVELAFSRAGLNGWEREGRRIRVPKESQAAYLAAVAESPLPISLHSLQQEAINETSVFDSNESSLRRVMHAKEQDLGSTIPSFRRSAGRKSSTIAGNAEDLVAHARNRPASWCNPKGPALCREIASWRLRK